MTASYPSSIRIFTAKSDEADDLLPEHFDDIQEEIVAIETELGLNPQGTYDTVDERLDSCYDKMLYLFDSVKTGVGWNPKVITASHEVTQEDATIIFPDLAPHAGNLEAILLKLRGQDSVAFATDRWVYFQVSWNESFPQLACYPLGGDLPAASNGLVFLMADGKSFKWQANSSGTDTLDINLALMGYILKE